VAYIPGYSLRAVTKNPMFYEPAFVEKLVESLRVTGVTGNHSSTEVLTKQVAGIISRAVDQRGLTLTPQLRYSAAV